MKLKTRQRIHKNQRISARKYKESYKSLRKRQCSRIMGKRPEEVPYRKLFLTNKGKGAQPILIMILIMDMVIKIPTHPYSDPTMCQGNFYVLSIRYHFTSIKLAKLLKAQHISTFGKDVKQWKLPGTAGENRSTLQSNLAISGQVEGANISFRWTFREIYTYTQEFSEESHL